MSDVRGVLLLVTGGGGGKKAPHMASLFAVEELGYVRSRGRSSPRPAFIGFLPPSGPGLGAYNGCWLHTDVAKIEKSGRSPSTVHVFMFMGWFKSTSDLSTR